jgi:hypothetical protein
MRPSLWGSWRPGRGGSIARASPSLVGHASLRDSGPRLRVEWGTAPGARGPARPASPRGPGAVIRLAGNLNSKCPTAATALA